MNHNIILMCFFLTISNPLFGFNFWPFNRTAKKIQSLEEQIKIEQQNLSLLQKDYHQSMRACLEDSRKRNSQHCTEQHQLQQFIIHCIQSSQQCTLDLNTIRHLNMPQTAVIIGHLEQLFASAQKIQSLEKEKENLLKSKKMCSIKKAAPKAVSVLNILPFMIKK